MPGSAARRRCTQPALVLGVEEAEEQGDGHGLDARGLDCRDQAVDLGLGQRRDDLAVGADALADLEAAAARDESAGRILEQVVEVAAGGAPQLQDVAEAARGDERGARAVLRQDGVGDDRGGMREQHHLGRLQAVALHGAGEPGEHALGEVARRGRHLGDADRPARIVDQRHIRERAADVDPNPPSHVEFCPQLPGAKLKQIDGGAPTHGRPRHNSYALEGDEAVDAEKD